VHARALVGLVLGRGVEQACGFFFPFFFKQQVYEE
jgi:hypothetical protein